MGNGLEKLLFDKFCELLQKHSVPKHAVDELDWLVFVEHMDEFWALSKEDRMEVRMFIETLRQIHGR